MPEKREKFIEPLHVLQSRQHQERHRKLKKTVSVTRCNPGGLRFRLRFPLIFYLDAARDSFFPKYPILVPVDAAEKLLEINEGVNVVVEVFLDEYDFR